MTDANPEEEDGGPLDPTASEREPEEGLPNAANSRSTKTAAKRAKAEAAEEAEALAMLLNSKAGRRWYARLLTDACGMYRPLASQAYDNNSLHFREGARLVGLHLHKEALQKAKPQYMVLLAETLS